MSARRLLVALDGSPVREGSVDRLLAAVIQGAEEAGGRALCFRCNEMNVKPCQACGPEPTQGCCIFHDDMDAVYAALESAHAIAVGSPIYFDGVSGQLKLLIDRCNCITPLVRDAAGGWAFRPRWQRTRRAVFVTACGAGRRTDLAERSVRGFLKWIGAKWEESIVWMHADDEVGSVPEELLQRARAAGRRMIESPPLVPAPGA